MTREQLEYAIRAACDVAGDHEVWVFGSQAILAEHPDAPPALRRSKEADIAPKNRPDRVDRIDGALGELSQFHRTHSFYVHGILIESTVLPPGWEGRAIPVRNDNTLHNTGWCVEGHDLAISKLVAFRYRDREFVRVLLGNRMIDPGVLLDRLEAVEVNKARRAAAVTWVRTIREDIEQGRQ